MIATGSVRTEGADIVYDVQGQGPMLLMIPGGGGVASHYTLVSDVLAADYTVVSFDRRGNSRSIGDASGDLDVAQQARDAVAVIRALDHDRAYVFGSSGGADIAFQMAADHPEAVIAMVAHEAPTLSVLPDADECSSSVEKIHSVFTTNGAAAAIKAFAASLAGVDIGSVGTRVTLAEQFPNPGYFMAREYLPFSLYRPAWELIRRNHVRIVTAAGRESGEAWYARTARRQAELLGCDYVEFPSNHLGFIFDPEGFAATLHATLRRLSDAEAPELPDQEELHDQDR